MRKLFFGATLTSLLYFSDVNREPLPKENICYTFQRHSTSMCVALQAIADRTYMHITLKQYEEMSCDDSCSRDEEFDFSP